MRFCHLGPGDIGTAIARVQENDSFWDLLLTNLGGGPFDGACLVCARALMLTFGGEFVRLDCAGRADHYGARIQGVIFDFDGPAPSPAAWINRFRANELVDHQLAFQVGLGLPGTIPDDPETARLISDFLERACACHGSD